MQIWECAPRSERRVNQLAFGSSRVIGLAIISRLIWLRELRSDKVYDWECKVVS